MKVKNDHRSKFSNLSNWKAEAWKKVRALLLLLFHRVQFEKMTQILENFRPVTRIFYGGMRSNEETDQTKPEA